MQHYSVIPNDWDYSHITNDQLKDFNSNGCYFPSQVQEVVDKCGSLFPFITTKTNAIAYVKDLKKKFPYVSFNLLVGETWGNSKLVQSF